MCRWTHQPTSTLWHCHIDQTSKGTCRGVYLSAYMGNFNDPMKGNLSIISTCLGFRPLKQSPASILTSCRKASALSGWLGQLMWFYTIERNWSFGHESINWSILAGIANIWSESVSFASSMFKEHILCLKTANMCEANSARKQSGVSRRQAQLIIAVEGYHVSLSASLVSYCKNSWNDVHWQDRPLGSSNLLPFDGNVILPTACLARCLEQAAWRAAVCCML